MKNIEIITPQNVAVSYELSGLKERIFAAFIDYSMIGCFLSIVTLIVTVANPYSGQKFFYILLPFLASYTLISEWLMQGQTLGKKALGIRVMKMDGSPLQFTDCAVRWLLRSIEVFSSSGIIASFFISSSKWHQRVGDLVANTVVAKVRVKVPNTLQHILKLSDEKSQKLSYMNYFAFTEDEILLAKRVIDRAKKYKNHSHQEATKLLADKFRDRLNDPALKKVPDNVLIRGVIMDYVILTR